MTQKRTRSRRTAGIDPFAHLFNPLEPAEEQRLALATQLAKRELLGLLPEKVRRTSHAKGLSIRWEEKAAAIAETDPAVATAFAAYRSALNAFWAYCVVRQVPDILSRRFRRRFPKHRDCMSLEDLIAEATSELRARCAAFKPGKAPLIAYAQRQVFLVLRERCAQAVSPVTLPQKVARNVHPLFVASIDHEPHAASPARESASFRNASLLELPASMRNTFNRSKTARRKFRSASARFGHDGTKA